MAAEGGECFELSECKGGGGRTVAAAADRPLTPGKRGVR